LLAPRHLIFTALDGALLDSRDRLSPEAEEALFEVERRHVPLVLISSRTRAEIEPLRRKIGHNHPFITEGGGGIFFPDGYLNVQIPDSQRIGRYLGITLGRPYQEVCEALDDIAEECKVGVAGFHHMSTREIAENLGLRSRDAELVRSREFDEPFYFTSNDENAITQFVDTSKERGFDARSGEPFWHYSSGCDIARAVRIVTKLYRDATRNKFRAVGIASEADNVSWLRAVDLPVTLRMESAHRPPLEAEGEDGADDATERAPSTSSWASAVLSIIS
jgi:mannosyl-3-phosphoglycerate phosphatase